MQFIIDKVDIIIPARNEAQTIFSIVNKCYEHEKVDNVYVVNNDSVDNTGEIATLAGANVSNTKISGYGRAVKHAIKKTTNEWIVKIDADLENFSMNWIEVLINNAIQCNCYFVKTCWLATEEDPDRVTNFTVKPALKIFYPELSSLSSPLSGIYIFNKNIIDFELLPNGFSFDVAMIIQAHKSNIKINEVKIESVMHATVKKQ